MPIKAQTFGEIIRAVREKKKLTLQQMASEVGLDTSLLAKLEKNQRKPSDDNITQIAKTIGVSEKILRTAVLSDEVAQRIADEEVNAKEVLAVAEEKIKYIKRRKH